MVKEKEMFIENKLKLSNKKDESKCIKKNLLAKLCKNENGQ